VERIETPLNAMQISDRVGHNDGFNSGRMGPGPILFNIRTFLKDSGIS
jgi:hypothetical protein